MANYKGTGVVFMRERVGRAGPAIERLFLQQLTEEERETYLRTLEFHWVPIEVITRLFEVAAPLLHPGNPQGLRLLGKAMASDHLNGVYRIVMKVVSIDSIIEKSARLWHTYHRLGKTRVDRVGPKLLHFVVVEYPGLPENFQECMCGYISQVLELAGGTAVRVSHGAIGPGQWCWKLSWC
jgi:uncharacterized protein (TIGR02265 family)